VTAQAHDGLFLGRTFLCVLQYSVCRLLQAGVVVAALPGRLYGSEINPDLSAGMFQKAEALYHLGDFEHSLMFYHRGLRLRPEMTMFRLGVQKAQEAIENTIGREHLLTTTSTTSSSATRSSTPAPAIPLDPVAVALTHSAASRIDAASPKPAKKNHGSLAVDREYLEQLLKHPGKYN